MEESEERPRISVEEILTRCMSHKGEVKPTHRLYSYLKDFCAARQILDLSYDSQRRTLLHYLAKKSTNTHS